MISCLWRNKLIWTLHRTRHKLCGQMSWKSWVRRKWQPSFLSHRTSIKIYFHVKQANLVRLDIPWWKCEIRQGYPGTARSQRGSVWCVLAVVLFIQHIILMSVTPTTFWGEQSSVITEALLLISNLSVALLADPSCTCCRDLLSQTYQNSKPIIPARSAFKLKVFFFFSR